MSARDHEPDVFTASYSLWMIMAFLTLAAGSLLEKMSLVPGLALVLLLPVVVIGCAILWVWLLLRNIRRRAWRGTASVVAAPLLTYLLFVLSDWSGFDVDRARFELGRSSYLAQVAEPQRAGSPRFKEFDWGGSGGAVGANIFYKLVYDESGQIVQQRRSDPRHTIEVKKMRDHFFLVTEIYQ
jgi:hypothetical protein